LIHRDIKPSNIIFVRGSPKLADIGLVAEVSEAKSYVGTEGFIPPEGPGTVQADIYSLGKVLYEISTGKDRNDYPELPAQLGNTTADRDLVQFNKIVLKACRSDLHQRYRSAEAMMTALRSFQFSEVDPLKEKARRKWTVAIGIIGTVIGAGIFAALLFRFLWLLNHAR
jgi:serine/threonine protein kinase